MSAANNANTVTNEAPGFFAKALAALTGPTAKTIGIAVASAAGGAVAGMAYQKKVGSAPARAPMAAE